MRRTKFTRYRRGVAATATISPAWLETFSPAVGQIRDPGSIGPAPRGMRGQAEVGRLADIAKLDLLKESVTGRLFAVAQVSKLAGMQRLFLVELYAPFSDDFDCGIVESFWSGATADWSINVDENALLVEDSSLEDSGGVFGCPFLYQTVEGDFDVYAGIQSQYVNPSIATTVYALIKAGNVDDDECAIVGIESTSTRIRLFFANYVGGGGSSVAGMDALPGVYSYLRLARFGCDLAGYFATTAKPPHREEDWTEITGIASASRLITHDAMRVGLAAYSFPYAPSADPLIKFDFIKHWIPVTR